MVEFCLVIISILAIIVIGLQLKKLLEGSFDFSFDGIEYIILKQAAYGWNPICTFTSHSVEASKKIFGDFILSQNDRDRQTGSYVLVTKDFSFVDASSLPISCGRKNVYYFQGNKRPGHSGLYSSDGNRFGALDDAEALQVFFRSPFFWDPALDHWTLLIQKTESGLQAYIPVASGRGPSIWRTEKGGIHGAGADAKPSPQG